MWGAGGYILVSCAHSNTSLYSVFVMCVCYNLILYYILAVSNIMYFIKKKKIEMFLHHTYSLPYRKYRQLYITIIECLNY